MKFQGRKKIAILMLFAVLFLNLFPITNGTDGIIITPFEEVAYAETVTIPPGGFCMAVNSEYIENGKKITITGSSIEIGLAHSSNSIPTGATVEWKDYDRSVINVEFSSDRYKATVKAVGPGYAQLAAIISYNGMDYQVYCQVYVPLQIDASNLKENNYGMVNNLKFGDGSMNVGFQLGTVNTCGTIDATHYLVKLKNTSYAASVTNKTLGDANSVYTVKPSIVWSSSDETVVTVDECGIVKAVGAGYADLTVETTTTYDGSTDKLTVPVFVSPLGQISTSADPMTDTLEFTAETNTFTINTNAFKSTNLVWTVHLGDNLSAEEINPETSPLMNMTLTEYGKSATFTDVKAGTYYITARPNKDYREDNSVVKILKIKVTVPVFFPPENIVMNVGDFYDILANTNLPSKNWYDFSSSDLNKAIVTSAGVITALQSGTPSITMIPSSEGSKHSVGSYTIKLKIIDGISLNMTNATIYTGAQLQLILTASNNSAPVTWVSSDTSIATVDEDGLVTGVKAGEVDITVTQNVGGVLKKLVCHISVVSTVTSIKLDPAEKDLKIGDNLTINATIDPKINNFKLNWVSSDESVVKISSFGNLSATVTGVSGGVAVISAINADNIVVGSCLIRVYQAIESITLSEKEMTVPLSAGWVQLYATILPDSAKNEEVVWSSSDTSVLTVDSNGKVTLKKAGVSTVMVVSRVDATIYSLCKITVAKSVTGIKLDYKSRDMYVGETFRLTYVVSPGDSTNAAVTWTSSNNSIASVDKNGLVSAKSVGTAVIIVKTTDGGYMGTCTINVSRTATAVKLDVTKLTMNVGDYYYLETTLTPKDSTETTLSWESSDKKIASVSKSGKVIAKSAGQAIIMVKTKSGSTGYCTVTVLQPVTGVKISSEAETLTVGDEIELTAEVLPAKATIQDVKWTSSDESVAIVNEKGEIEALSGGVTMITVTTDDGNYKDYCMITVEELITSIKLNKTWYRLGLGKTFQLKATINGEKATNKELSWSSSDRSVCVVNKNGKIRGLKLGYATITVRATDGSGAEATCSVRVCRLVTDISLDVNYLTIVQGKSYKLKTKVSPANATYKIPTYTTDNADVAIVNKDGTITGLTPGNCIITAKAKDSSGVKTICYVKVIAPVASTGVSISESEVVMSPGETKTVAFSIVPNNSTDTVTWSSDNQLVATVGAKSGKITAKGIGTANITVLTESGRKGTIKVFVVGLSKTQIELPQYTSTLISLEVDGVGASTLRVRWDVENQEIATVVNGKVTAKALGTTNVYAVVNGRRLTCKVTVVKIP